MIKKMEKQDRHISPRFLKWLLNKLYGRRCIGLPYSGRNRIIGIKKELQFSTSRDRIRLLVQTSSIDCSIYHIGSSMVSSYITKPTDTGKSFRLASRQFYIDSKELKDMLKNERQEEIF